ncbi:CubicO group peptidase (beta-lactamase class C family) [Catenuloplanes nepalensis]|uniref:CubicO group peptidase (Beta-lactamase class C family) n=1 Tax=Catenuloplanes nepalensis TaxID=587533 RepID=A0ABT9MKB9_9ACTN|nr:serine hydrolase domain-containing protein [Catenuloplanes nepalensis]MDP9791496.1 CubicO group peptidase (beta-lactamase class C family) [Catenuloplanes nepalensis]
MTSLPEAVDAIADEHGFSGVVSVDRGGQAEFARAYGLAHRAHAIPNTVDTRFAIASGAKALTALAVVSLIDDGVLTLGTTARSLLRDDLPRIDDRVTVEQLLAHRSGIGDYLDEDDEELDVDDYLLAVPMQQLAAPEDYIAVLDGHAAKFPPGEGFSYCNAGYVVLALIAERASGTPYHELVRTRVCAPARMRDTEFLRSDELPDRTALGYVPAGDGRWRSNVFHLPVRGVGDGGAYTTVADMSAFWRALFAGRIVPPRWAAEMVRPRQDVPGERLRAGLGFFLHQTRDQVMLMGQDAGVSFMSVHDPASALTYTVVSNTSAGAWPVLRPLRERFSDGSPG